MSNIIVTVAFEIADIVIPPSNTIPSSAKLYENTSPAGTSTWNCVTELPSCKVTEPADPSEAKIIPLNLVLPAKTDVASVFLIAFTSDFVILCIL